MSDVIRLLPDSVANQIAAGEVIQRPASVVKELVENAVDAGATDIQIIIKDAGKTLIQVVDNGCGMSDTDARMAFERHATSKIKKADDLFTLHTMGFRGEALPSICAISEVEIKTATNISGIGTRLLISGSKVLEQEAAVCEKGTSISVRKIFFNVPARRKFLRKDSQELSNIMREFERLALVNNHIRLRITTDTREIDLRPSSLRLRIEELWKNSLKSDHLIPVDVDTSLIKIEGFISRPEFARRRNPLQYLIVNGRNMRHPYFHRAILSCYESLIASDTMPCYFMRFTVDPSTIDVNIHPTKNEIKFEYEQQIWPILVSAVKTALGKYAAVPSIDFSVDAVPLDPLKPGEQAVAPKMNYNPSYNPFETGYRKRSTVETDWQKLYENFENPSLGSINDADNSISGTRPASSPAESRIEENRIFGSEVTPALCLQVGAKYIVTSMREGLAIIDQHRAHVRILYEDYINRASKNETVSQRLMFPDTISLDDSQSQALEGVWEEIHRLGFEMHHDHDGIWLINAVPPLPKSTTPADVVLRILDSVQEDSPRYGEEGAVGVNIEQRIALAMARAAAIRRGQKLSVAEMEDITGALFALPDPAYTPTGNPIYTLLDDNRLSSLLLNK